MAADKDSIANVLRVSMMVCLVCAIVVSTASVGLRPLQQENRMEYRQVNILKAADMYRPGMDVQAAFNTIERRFVEIDTGEYVERPDDYDQRRAARDPEQSRQLSDDPAGIRRQARVAEVFLVRDDGGDLERIVLPMHGYGLWSTMYGFLALEADANTIAGIGFYEHGETPGLGGEIDNPRWQQNWESKRLFDDTSDLAIRVIKGAVPADATDREHMIDGISGATLTINGVHAMVRFWAGESGFRPYLDRMREQYRSETGRDTVAHAGATGR